jgi:hypothetical protein
MGEGGGGGRREKGGGRIRRRRRLGGNVSLLICSSKAVGFFCRGSCNLTLHFADE